MTYAELRRALESLPLEDDEQVVIELDTFHQSDGVETVFTICQVAYEEPVEAEDGFRAVLVGAYMDDDGISRKRYDLDHLHKVSR